MRFPLRINLVCPLLSPDGETDTEICDKILLLKLSANVSYPTLTQEDINEIYLQLPRCSRAEPLNCLSEHLIFFDPIAKKTYIFSNGSRSLSFIKSIHISRATCTFVLSKSCVEKGKIPYKFVHLYRTFYNLIYRETLYYGKAL